MKPNKFTIPWGKLYPLPLSQHEKYKNYYHTKLMATGIEFSKSVEDKLAEAIVDGINGVKKLNLSGLTNEGPDFYLDGVHAFRVTGLSWLIKGTLKYKPAQAIRMERNFIEHINKNLKWNLETIN